MCRRTLFAALVVLVALSLAACAPSAPASAATATTVPTVAPSATPSPQPTDTPAPTATPTQEASIAGVWQVTNMEPCVTSAMSSNPSLTQGLTFEGMTGSMLYTFGEDSRVTMEAKDYTFNYKAALGSAEPLTLKVTVNGTATGNYALEEGNIRFTNGDPGTLALGVTANGQPMAGMEASAGMSVSGLFPGSTGEQRCTYSRDGETMTITVPTANSCRITLERVG